MVSPLPVAVLTLDPIPDIQQLTAYPFMVSALEAGTIVAILAGIAGWFMVLRRETFAGHTLSVMAFPGASGALLIGLPAAAGYFLFAGGAALAIGLASARAGRHRGEESAVTGAVQAFGLACGFVFLSLYQGVLAGYENLLFGSFFGITRGQVLTLAIVAVLTLAFFAVAGRPLLFASVDEPVARSSGVPVRRLSTGFLLVLGLAVAATAQITGSLLVFTLLVTPAATAQVLTARPVAGVALAVGIALAVTWTGLAVAYYSPYPVGFWITSLSFAVYVLARLGRALTDRRRSMPAIA